MAEIRSRKWQLTINNPLEHGETHDSIKQTLAALSSVTYWCMCDEIGGQENTYHTHVYLYASNAIRFSTLKVAFPTAHLEPAYGTSQQNRDYIRKEGKYSDSEKSTTNLSDTFEEWGELPDEQQGRRSDLAGLYDLIKDGNSDFEILESNPKYLAKLDTFERVRQIIREDQFKKQFRILDVSYIYGSTGSGKTRSVMEKYGYENVYRVTDYEHPFDSYRGQDVLIFEEFRSSLKVQDMLNYLDGYPVELPCRYANKVACFTKVYIITNIPITQQYVNLQQEQGETWKAFKRRIHHVLEYTPFGLAECADWENMKIEIEQMKVG